MSGAQEERSTAEKHCREEAFLELAKPVAKHTHEPQERDACKWQQIEGE